MKNIVINYYIFKLFNNKLLYCTHFQQLTNKPLMARPKKPLTPAQQIENLSIQLAELDIEFQAQKLENEQMQNLVKKLGQNATDHQNLSSQLMHQRDRLLIATVEIKNECENKTSFPATIIDTIHKLAVSVLTVATPLYKKN